MTRSRKPPKPAKSRDDQFKVKPLGPNEWGVSNSKRTPFGKSGSHRLESGLKHKEPFDPSLLEAAGRAGIGPKRLQRDITLARKKGQTVSGVKPEKKPKGLGLPHDDTCELCNAKLPRKYPEIKRHFSEVHGKQLSDGEIHQRLSPPFDPATPYAEEFSGDYHAQAGAPGLGKRR